ncbi:putative F-box/LRR-repeat protein At5g38386 [Carex rostrata]
MEGRDMVRDKISELPDNLLSTHILSLLPAEEAVRTSILSKRWMKVWVSLPVLLFDDHKTPTNNLTEEEFLKSELKFLRFFRGVLFHRENLPLDKFQLKWWDSIFTCTSIEEMSLRLDTIEEMSLRLNNTIWIDEEKSISPRSMNLPFLKKLQLGDQQLNDDIMIMFMSGCPVLEELVLKYCCLEVNMISSNVLKKLVVKYCVFDVPMEISCPEVVSLSIKSINTGGITLKNMSSLVTADISFEEIDLSDSLNHDLRLLGGLSNVTSLKLDTSCPDVMNLLQEDIPNCPTLENLKSLYIGDIDVNFDWDLAACILKHSSNLKDLTLCLFRDPSDDAAEEGDISFQHEYLEAVKRECPGKNVKLSSEKVLKFDKYVCTLTEIIIL